MLVANDCRGDSRVLKQAFAAQGAGFDVLVLASQEDGPAGIEVHRDVVFSRFQARPRLHGGQVDLDGTSLFPERRTNLASRSQLLWLQARLLATRLIARLLAPISNFSNAVPHSSLWHTRLQARGGELKNTRRALEQTDPGVVCRRHKQFYQGTIGHVSESWAQLSPKIIHAHDLYTLPAGVWFAKTTNARLIYDAHEYERGRYNFSPDQLAAFAALEDNCLRHVDRVITVGKEIARLYADHAPHSKPVVIYNTPVIPASDGIGCLRALTGLKPEVPLLVYTGRVHGVGRGLDVVAQALRMLPDVHLAVLGPRVERYDQWLNDVVDTCRINDRVHLLAPVAPDEVVDNIRDADVGLCLIQDVALSYRYCMPNKLFELSFAGIPVVVSDLPELGGFVREIGNGVAVDQTDPKSVADGVRQLLEGREAFRPSSRGKQQLRDEYSWTAQATRLLTLYGDTPISANAQWP